MTLTLITSHDTNTNIISGLTVPGYNLDTWSNGYQDKKPAKQMQVADYQLTVERNIFHVSSPHPRRDCRLAGPRLCTAAPATVMSGPGRPPPPPGHSGLGPVCPSSTGHNNLSGVKHLCSYIFTDCVLTWPGLA